MLETYIKSSVTRKRLREGLAAPYVVDFAGWLHSQGFKAITIEGRLRSLAAWTDWMREAGLNPRDPVAGFEACKAMLKNTPKIHYSKGPNKHTIFATSIYIRFLRAHGMIARLPVPPSPVDSWPILGEFRSWMKEHRGLKETTLDLYEFTLLGLIKSLGDEPRAYTAKSIRDFVFNQAKPHGHWRAKAISVAVRSYLRFLGITGRCKVGLEYAVLANSSYQLQSVPRYLEPADLKRVVDSCVSNDANGLRDRAVILLLSRLGRRASDVAQLTFADIDWKNGRIAVCGKNRRQEWLPLPQDIGNAIMEYIKGGRPPLKIDQIFTKVDAPLGPLTRASVTHIVRSALRRAKIKAPINGAHVLRHSAATAMLREGVSLLGVGAVLRHNSLSTTAIYSKVDFGLLSEVGQEWPEVTSC